MLRLRWCNETGGEWIDGNTYNSIAQAEAQARYAFEDGEVDEDDIIQAWFVEEFDIDEKIGNTAAGEWMADDFVE